MVTEVWSPTFVALIRRGLQSADGRELFSLYIKDYCQESRQRRPDARTAVRVNLMLLEDLAHGLEDNPNVARSLALLRELVEYHER
jgi:hypothetical protein